MDYKEAWTLIGGLSAPSKMPWYGFSISAHRCITGSKLRKVENSTCSFCYALRNRYLFPNVQNAMERRFVGLSNPLWEDAFVKVLTQLYYKGKKTYLFNGKQVKENRFRWHDSGDVSSLDHLTKINNIALRTPFLRHWLPTRETAILKQWKGDFAPNLNIRFSVPMIGAKLNRVVLELTQSTVGRDTDKTVYHCVAPKQNNHCLDCSACWTKSIPAVNYKLH